jgi:Ca2+-binding RTX toxin-like protein
LSGTNSYTGLTTINDGRLDLLGTLTSAVSVNNSAIFGGSGSTTGTINANNTSRVSPGQQIGATVGRLTTSAATTLTVNSFLDIELAGTAGAGLAGGHDQLRTNGVTLSAATLNLSGAYIPTEATLSSFTIVENTSALPTTSRLNIGGNVLEEGEFINFNGGKLFISYLGGDGNDVVLSTQLMGSFLPNLLQVTPVSSNSISYNLDGINTYTITGINRFTFNGGGNDDVMAVTLSGFLFPSGGIFYNGDSQAAPLPNGANPSHGDVLSVVDPFNTSAAIYRPDGVANPALDNDGRVTVLGNGGTINFTGLEPVDMAGFAAVNVQLPNGDDIINIDNGFDAASGVTVPAMVISGSSGGVPFEALHLSSNTTVSIDTTQLVNGNDTITINSANNAHLNQNLTIVTGTGTDTITVNGNATFSGDVTLASQNIAFNGGLLTANAVSLNAGTGAISTNGIAGDVAAVNVFATATTGIDLDTNIGRLVANNTGAGNIRIDETNAIDLHTVTAANGSILVNAAGLVQAGSIGGINSNTDNDANDVTIFTSVSDINVFNITTGGTASDVTLTATNGFILDDVDDASADITGDVVSLTAANGIGAIGGNGSLDTVAQSINASVTSAGLIAIDELNTVTLTSVSTADGLIRINAGGSIVATSVVSSTSSEPNDITLTNSLGNITIGVINAGTNLADVFLTSFNGSIIDNGNDLVTDVTGDLVAFNAPTGLIGNVGTQNIDTAANRTTFAAASGVWINELNAVTVVASAGTGAGPVVFAAGGTITLQTTMNAVTGNVLVTTTGGGDLILDTNALITSGSATGAVRLNIANSIVDTQATNDILATNLNITAGNDVGSAANPIESTITNLGATTGVGGDFYLDERDELNITAVTAFGNTQTGLNIGGITVINTGSDPASTSATMNVMNNVTGAGDVTLRAIDRSGSADSIVLTDGVSISSTTGDLTLSFGDNETLNATHKLDVGPTKTINLLSNDLDNGSTIQLQGIVSAKTVNVVGANNNDFFVLKADTVLDAASTLNLTGKDGSDTYGNAVDRINPTNAIINIEGDTTFNVFPEARPGTDSLFLDASVLSAPVVFFAGRVKGTLEGGDAKFQKVNYEDLEALTFYDNGVAGANSGVITNVVLGPLYVRGTTFDDDVNFIRSGVLGSTDVQAIIKWNGQQKYFGPFQMGPVDAAGKLVVYGKEGNDRIRSSLSGTIPTTNRDVEFHGGLGNDYLVGGTGNALMIGDEGNDTINTSASQAQHNVVIWGDAEGSYDNHEGSLFPIAAFPDGNDNIITGPSNDLIYGGGGNDTIGGAAGNDIIYGGDGHDTIYGGDGNDLIRGSTGNDVISGDNGNDLILGDNGNDKIYGRIGNDVLIGGDGIDLVDGNAGNDVVVGGLASAYDDISTLAAARAHEAALLALVSSWVGSGTFSATITEDGDVDTLASGTGNDRLYVHEVALDPTNDIHDFALAFDTKINI